MLHGSAVAAGISDDASIACQKCAVTDGPATRQGGLTIWPGRAGSAMSALSGSRRARKDYCPPLPSNFMSWRSTWHANRVQTPARAGMQLELAEM